MSRDGLLEQVPTIARYRREPLEDDRNAVAFWDEASKALVELDDEELYDQLVCEAPESRDVAAFPTGAGAERVRTFLENNRKALDLHLSDDPDIGAYNQKLGPAGPRRAGPASLTIQTGPSVGRS